MKMNNDKMSHSILIKALHSYLCRIGFLPSDVKATLIVCVFSFAIFNRQYKNSFSISFLHVICQNIHFCFKTKLVILMYQLVTWKQKMHPKS